MPVNNQKSIPVNSGKDKQKLPEGPVSENLGLDADQSSENFGRMANLNNDNDRISHNPDGEDDDHDTHESPGYSPLMDK